MTAIPNSVDIKVCDFLISEIHLESGVTLYDVSAEDFDYRLDLYDYLRARAEAGNADAMFELSVADMHIDNPLHNQSLSWLCRAVVQENPRAMNNLGCLLYFDKGNLHGTISFAEEMSLESPAELETTFQEYLDSKTSKQKGLELILAAAKRGNTIAMANLVYFKNAAFIDDSMVPIDISDWEQRILDSEDGWAIYRIAQMQDKDPNSQLDLDSPLGKLYIRAGSVRVPCWKAITQLDQRMRDDYFCSTRHPYEMTSDYDYCNLIGRFEEGFYIDPINDFEVYFYRRGYRHMINVTGAWGSDDGVLKWPEDSWVHKPLESTSFAASMIISKPGYRLFAIAVLIQRAREGFVPAQKELKNLYCLPMTTIHTLLKKELSVQDNYTDIGLHFVSLYASGAFMGDLTALEKLKACTGIHLLDMPYRIYALNCLIDLFEKKPDLPITRHEAINAYTLCNKFGESGRAHV